MRRIASVYLAGPDPWYPDAAAHDARRKALCRSAGFEAQSGLDVETVETTMSEAMAREIYADAMGRIRRSDAVIANLSPFRGPGCDPSAAYVMGFASALSKPVFAYLNVATEDEADYRARVAERAGAILSPEGLWRDADGGAIEDFGLPESLMLWAEARRLLVIVTDDPLGDLTGLALSLDGLRAYAAV